MAKRNVVDFKIINLSEEKFQELKEAGQIDPNALYTTPDESLKRNQITNCITEIPQDIKLELTSDGKVIAKAGSKFYKPNGAEYTPTTIDHDISIGIAETTSGKFFLFVGGDRGYDYFAVSRCCSGTTDIYAGLDYHAWYDTTNNQIKMYRDDGTTVAYTQAFPCAIITTTNGKITSIDQVFNGFGYIGSTIFALPGIKWLAPNGRNADGTLRNNAYTSTKAQKFTYQNVNQSNIVICMGTDSFYTSGQVISSETEPTKAYTFWYKPSENILRTKAEGAYNLAQSAIPVGSFNMTTTGVSSVYTKTPFHAVDYNDLYSSTSGSLMSRILYAVFPVGSLYLTTHNTHTCPIAALIPGSTWEMVVSGRALWTGNGSNGNTTIAAGLPNITGSVGAMRNDDTAIRAFTNASGAFYTSDYGSSAKYAYISANEQTGVPNKAEFSASRSSSVYGSSNTVQPPAYVVNVWRRTA
jgi:hypothetical protein